MSRPYHPSVSVIMATYNRPQLLPRAIDSILNQTMKNFELIIVDDGSTDNTPQILKQYQQQDNRIIIIRQPNSGPTVARNTSIGKARGKYIALMDDDDISLPQRLEKQLTYLEHNPDKMACVSFFYKINSQQEIIEKIYYTPFNKLSNIQITIPCPTLLSAVSLINTQAILSCQSYRPFFYSAEDIDLTLRFQEKFSIGVVDEFLYSQMDPTTSHIPNISTGSLLNRIYCHLIAYISAYYRRFQNYDPISQHQTANKELIIDLASSLPQDIKTKLINSIGYMLRSIKYEKHLDKEKIRTLLVIITLFDQKSPLLNKVRRRTVINLIKNYRWRELYSLLSDSL